MSDDTLDQMPQTDEEADRASLDNVVMFIPRCPHPWIDPVCTTCGLVIGPAEMHPEER
jgi:hypothetical protein